MRNVLARILFAAALAGLLNPIQSVLAQGSLTPPGAPAPTMKTLAQIEARTPVDATNTPAIFNAEFAITQPGSYYLTGNITGLSTKTGILILTNDVTLDLNGFVMTGAGSNYSGITVSPFGFQNIVIRNGTLRNWGAGVTAGNGYCELEHVRVYGSASGGFQLGDHCTVRNCTVSGNGSTGITIGNDCAVTDCLVSSNATGISGGSDCTMSGTHANYNLDDGVDLTDNFDISRCSANGNGANYANTNYSDFAGFHLGNNGTVAECTANGNGGPPVNYLGNIDGYGFEVGSGCTVNDCTASGNGLRGIFMVSNCQITGNTCNSGNGGPLVGIEIDGNGNRIDNNNLGNIPLGIYPDNTNVANSITRNFSPGKSYSNYSGNNDYAPIQTPSTATSPWANF